MFDIRRSIGRGDSGRPAAAEYIEGLMEEFNAAPESKPIVEQYGRLGWAGSMMEYGISHLGVTPAKMTRRDFEEVVFGLFPEKVLTDPSSAACIIAELHAFWTFLKRAYTLPIATAILAVLEDRAAERLERMLADPENYGMAKSFFMKGKELGFDMTTQEGLDEFMLYYNSQLAAARGLPPFGGQTFPRPPEPDFEDIPEEGPPLPPPLSPKERAEMRKKKRKAEQQARKRNQRKK